MTNALYAFRLSIAMLMLSSSAFAQTSIPDASETRSPKHSLHNRSLFGKSNLAPSLKANRHVDDSNAHNTQTRLKHRRLYYDRFHDTAPTQSFPKSDSERAVEAIESNDSPKESPKTKSTFGIGIRLVGFYPGQLSRTSDETLKFNLNGGGGLYVKLRPMRWISIEFITDFTVGSDKKDHIYASLPLSLGLRAHLFDYGILDIYGVAAFSTNFMLSSRSFFLIYPRLGGQFGAGATVILSLFELGLDLRYTIDSHISPSSDAKIQHGFVFSVNIGLAF